jgi:hypothetical protein
MGRKRQYLFPKALEERLQRLTLEYEGLPENFPQPQAVYIKVVKQFRAFGIEPEPGNRGPIAQMMIEEADTRWRAIVCHFGKYSEKPFVTRAAMVAAGKWVKKNTKAKPAKIAEVNAAVREIVEKITEEEYAKLSQAKVAEMVFKKIGKTTTEKTIRACKSHRQAKRNAQLEKLERTRKLMQSSD